ncbi:Protein of unknown function [Anaplasma phagocytophilum]|uniref:Uncharacterized protein n=1 Tax=Anaplasma phagocytophilum TaxID=948 RepID=A0A098EGI7_ANAPH|nr:Protein of unknown function [Anaplasma phagocytophilum]
MLENCVGFSKIAERLSIPAWFCAESMWGIGVVLSWNIVSRFVVG